MLCNDMPICQFPDFGYKCYNMLYMKKIALFASGSGTNAENLIKYFSNGKKAKVVAVFTNNPKAFVIKRAERLGVDVVIFDRGALYDSSELADELIFREIDLIVLAGFLWKIPPSLTEIWRDRIINIHPALLPAYGGRGMYGEHVHRAVLDAGETRSGITIHYVNEEYDKGDTIFSATCDVLPGDTPSSLADRIHQLEYKYYPRVIEEIAERLPPVQSRQR